MNILECNIDLAKASFYCAQEYLLRMTHSGEPSSSSSDDALRYITCVWDFFGFLALCLALKQGHKFPLGVKSMPDMYAWDFSTYEPLEGEERQTFLEDVAGIEELRVFIATNGVGGHNLKDFTEILQLCKVYGRRLVGLNL